MPIECVHLFNHVFDAVNTSNVRHCCSPEGATLTISIMFLLNINAKNIVYHTS